jgi:multidrug transporter EmrE-like cation transporter
VKTLFIALISITLSVAAQFLLKSGMSSGRVSSAMTLPFGMSTLIEIFTNLHVLGGFILYSAGAIAWLGVLAQWDVSKAYPLVGLGFALTVIFGLIAGEHVTFQRVMGVALICTGVLFVAKS